jgi:3-phytase/alkaline phosphatase D
MFDTRLLSRWFLLAGLLLFMLVPVGSLAATAQAEGGDGPPWRFSTFNASLNRSEEGELIADLSTPDDEQAQTVAEIIQRVNPDVLLVNEFDFDENGEAVDLFRENYLEVSQNGATPISYPYAYTAPSNTGIPSGYDLNNDGTVGGPDDAFGFGFFPGQYGMVVYSKYPILTDQVRTFQLFLWRDMPGALLPFYPDTGDPWYTDEELDVVRLSSKSHWDVPVDVGGQVVHVLASHPTPPVFDGEEDRNGKRNSDEIRFWVDYITPGQGDYIYDDEEQMGGLPAGESFVIVGDLNSDPFDGDSLEGSVEQLLTNPLVNTSVTPTSEGAVEQAMKQGGANESHEGDPAHDTADFADDPGPGNLRADYALPSASLSIEEAAVFWPTSDDPYFYLVGVFPFPSSDHRLVWVDLSLVPTAIELASFSSNGGGVPSVVLMGGVLFVLVGLARVAQRRR